MPKYYIEQRIVTLAQNAVMENWKEPTFTMEEIVFKPWEFNHRDGWTGQAWIATSTEMGNDFLEAYSKLNSKLHRIIPRISFICQAYIEHINESFLVTKEESNFSFFRYVHPFESVGLMFMEPEFKALELLLKEANVSDEFYYYWNDAVNTTGYSAKLLLMFSALEALYKSKPGNRDWSFVEEVLGSDLKFELYGTEQNPKTGIRHRLTHGEYFDPNDQKKNYMELVHHRMVKYFNSEILKEKLIREDIVSPQRQMHGKKMQLESFIEPNTEDSLMDIKSIFSDFQANNDKPTQYKFVYPRPQGY